jgi:hypothetical protein
MAPRKPRLDWINAVLADLEAEGERAPAAFGFLRQDETTSADVHAMLTDLKDRRARIGRFVRPGG